MVDLGLRLAIVRHSRKKSQQEIAALIGISRKHLGQVENGKFPLLNLRCGVIVALAKILVVSTDYLLGMTDEGGIDFGRAAAPA